MAASCDESALIVRKSSLKIETYQSVWALVDTNPIKILLAKALGIDWV